ncbi:MULTISPECIES: MOSC domain-containing protein [unclassified Methylibium]|uniref:MOSC domain-containing protein n=1 Tax=unclassified Methylibium TaxID=2633235 RepID=UPI0003F3D115|nr:MULTISPECIES: MOSC domain-containing protein [unclassified Methylibium]EWS52647.1 6-N-hydroxylaminopurine resistance protein [Methylibium sp. T29]EWS57645.1 6-N-hydroxylaminopurine resistance protein [Methylibium sp. T29-B]
MSNALRVLSVNVAAARPLDVGENRRVLSAIGKRGVSGAVGVGRLGLAGDEQADPTVHGGLDKAVYAYPSEHYAFWQTVRAQARVAPWDEALPHGFMGENLTLAGLREGQLWIGDVLRFPHCALAVAAPRQPCYKFNAVMGFNQAAKMMLQSGYCGVYLAVREPGTIAAGETGVLQPGPREVGIPELFRAVMGRHRRD